MRSRIPDIYEEFHCIASQCKHSCCIGWEIDVDQQTYMTYCKLDSEFGERLREAIKKDKTLHMQMVHGKCPFLSEEHLCTVYQQLGPEEMCDICTEYPRFEVQYGEIEEKALTLSCEEAGRLLFSKKEKIQWLEKELPALRENEIEMADEGRRIYHDPGRRIERARDMCLNLLQDREIPLKQRIASFLRFSGSVQTWVASDHDEPLEKLMKEAVREKKERPYTKEELHQLFQKRMDAVCGMEVMEEEWEAEINNVMRAFHPETHREVYYDVSAQFEADQKEREYEYEHLIVYFVYRYLIEAVFDGNFLEHAKFAVLCYLIIRDLDRMRYLIQGQSYTLEDRIETARIFSRQVEHSKKSMEYLEQRIKNDQTFQLENMIRSLE